MDCFCKNFSSSLCITTPQLPLHYHSPIERTRKSHAKRVYSARTTHQGTERNRCCFEGNLEIVTLSQERNEGERLGVIVNELVELGYDVRGV